MKFYYDADFIRCQIASRDIVNCVNFVISNNKSNAMTRYANLRQNSKCSFLLFSFIDYNEVRWLGKVLKIRIMTGRTSSRRRSKTQRLIDSEQQDFAPTTTTSRTSKRSSITKPKYIEQQQQPPNDRSETPSSSRSRISTPASSRYRVISKLIFWRFKNSSTIFDLFVQIKIFSLWISGTCFVLHSKYELRIALFLRYCVKNSRYIC